MKIDKQVRNISNKLDSISNNGNGKYKHHEDGDDGDEYYLSIDSEPPRFLYYRQVRAEKWEASGPHGPSEYDDSITQDELDYALKWRLRMSPEQRYQMEKSRYYFHELYVDGERECNPACGGCTPNCRFYPEYGRIEDDEVIAEHKKLVESARRDNRIVDIPLPPSKNEGFT